MRRWLFSSGAVLMALQLSSISHCGASIGVGADGDSNLVLIDGISPNAIAVCGGFVYWVGAVCDGGVPTGPANLSRIPVAGGANEVVAVHGGDRRSIVCDDLAVYFWQKLDQLAAAPLDGGTPSVTAVGVSDPGILATNDTSIFWSGNDGVYTLADGSVTTVSNVGASGGIAATNDHVYWLASSLDGGGLLAQSLDAGAQDLLWAGQSSSRLGLTSSRVYWVQYDPASLMQVELDGGAVSTLLADAGAGPALLPPLVADGADVYWVSATDVRRVSVNGNANAIMFTLGVGTQNFAAADLALDETSLYVSIQSAPTGLPCGSIVKIRK